MFRPLEDRGPLRILFMTTSMPVGGAEMLLVNLIDKLDDERFQSELCCLKEPGPLGEQLADQIPVHSRLLQSKWDIGVLSRLTDILKRRKIDAVVTVGAGDKMFWGRLAGWRAGTPVVLAALHSTGWPDGVGRLNRLLTPITDGFIGVASEHGRHLVEQERFPADKVHVIPNGVNVQRFAPQADGRRQVRDELGWDDDRPVCGIVAALRPEKNHLLFLRAARLVHQKLPEARFLIVGDGPQRAEIERGIEAAGLGEAVRLLGTRKDIPEVLNAMDLFALTSHNEANPVSILEAFACGLPVVSTDVGSIAETVRSGVNGYLAASGDAESLAQHWLRLLSDLPTARQFGKRGRALVEKSGSLEAMVSGYERLITEIYQSKVQPRSEVTDAPVLVPSSKE